MTTPTRPERVILADVSTQRPGRVLVACQGCGKPFETVLSRLKKGHGKTCSRACTFKYWSATEVARFDEQVDKSGGCWLWTGPKDRQGYGHSRVRGVSTRAHRAAYEFYVGPITDGLWVLHRCDNPTCVNPKHLYLGTALENNRDTVARGRRAKGTPNDQ